MIAAARTLPAAMRTTIAIGCAVAAACGGDRRAHPAPAPTAPTDARPPGDARAPAAPGCDGVARPLTPGVTHERHRIDAPSPLPAVEPCIDVVRIDLALHRPALLMASRDGAPRPIPRWLAGRDAVAAINAGMFGPDHRGLGHLADADHVDRDRDNPRYGGWLVFDPIDPADPPARVLGRDCAGADGPATRSRYRAAIQSCRFLDCAGAALPWSDAKAYSAAGFGVDRAGRLVMVHARAPFRMGDLATRLAGLDLAGLLYAEGGPEATLVAGRGADRLERLGSYEAGFWDDDSNHTAWDVPNVLYAVPRATSPSAAAWNHRR